ncbi:MBL fold metallo-hydrolase [Dyadobacter psychrotolerans]|uniref:MBL fold metallo-hydrolase n=1 Tax=Dyadobacter psychrotolerans TaxID=2541721 RepID=A0A4V6PFT6_9BACT|nr:MBL fold metallo-hydrolase [Dyadobacter psychrotolerans]TDE15608.1 MBL fold metallo-hydrolase [Dyadobacter psychrotolerans]
MEILPLEEGIYSVDKKKNLSPVTGLDSAQVPGFLQMAVRPFLIRLKNDLVLLDCGLGIVNGSYMMTSVLGHHGINSGQITKVLLSHLHKDHIEGLGYFQNSEFVQQFGNATIYANRQEHDYALSQKGNPSYNDDLVEQLAGFPNLQLMDAMQGNLSPEIYFEVVDGHTPYHLAFRISEGDQTIFYGGDNLPQAHYLDYHIAYKTDYDGKKAMTLRQKWQNESKHKHWTVLLYHDLKLPMLKFNN